MKENNMKPKRSQKHTGASWQGKSGLGGDKSALSQATAAMLATRTARPKPFVGKVFYLDLPANRAAESLENDIKELGGTVEKFFSKEIKYLVSNKREAKYVQCLKQDSPVPSPDSGQSSPHPHSNPTQPGNPGRKIQSRSQVQADSFVSSRGKSLVERAVKERERLQMNKILANALEWGVKILYVDDVVAYVKRKLKAIASRCPAPPTPVKPAVKTEQATKQSSQKSSTGRIRKPFIKVEDSSRHYRPIYLSLPNVPKFSLTSAPPCSPFLCEERDHPGNRQRAHRGARASASDDRAHGRKKNKDKKRSGYCECCMIKYDNMETHLRGERHQAFSKSDKYLVVDSLVSTMHFSFAELKPQVKRPKCGVSSVLVRPCGKTEQRHRGDSLHATIIKEEQQTVGGCEEAFSGRDLGMAAVPGCAPPDRHGLSGGSNGAGALDRSRRRSLARKRPSRRSPATGKAETPRPKTETPPRSGEDTPISHTQPNVSAAHLRHPSVPKETDLVGLDAPEKSEEPSRRGNASLEKARISEEGGDRSPAQSDSPDWKIKRKVRAYKRKRRKLSALLAHHEQPGPCCNESLLKLKEIFQSSDDMDVEFLGFS